MPITISVLPDLPDIPEHKERRKSTHSSAASVRPKTIRRKVSEETTIYGEELLVASIRKEREIIVHFTDFNPHGFRFSDDGEFVIHYRSPKSMSVFHCLLKIEYNENINDIQPSEFVHKWDFDAIEDAGDKILSIIREQYFGEKQAKIQAQKEADDLNWQLEKQRRAALQKMEEERELQLSFKETTETVVDFRAAVAPKVEPVEINIDEEYFHTDSSVNDLQNAIKTSAENIVQNKPLFVLKSKTVETTTEVTTNPSSDSQPKQFVFFKKKEE